MLERSRNRASLRVPVCVGLALCAAAGTTLSAASAAGFQFGGGDKRTDSLRRVLAYQPQQEAYGAVELWSGADGSLLQRIESSESNDLFAFSATSVNDLDGDEFDDVVVGAPLSSAGGAASGRVDVISSATGRVLWSFAGSKHEMLGIAVHGVGDVDADKVPDVAAMGTTGRGDKRLSHVTFFSGATGQKIATFYGREPGDGFGSSVSNIGDRNGDGLAEVAIMAPGGGASSTLTILTPALPEAGSQEIDLARRVCEDLVDIIDVIDVIDIINPIDIDILVRFRYPGDNSNRTMGELVVSSSGNVEERVVQFSSDLAGDVNQDGMIDDADASLVASKLYQIVEDDSPIRTDLNHDGFTDASDLATVLISASTDAPTTTPALLDAMRERDEQGAFYTTLLSSSHRLNEGEQVIATLLAGCQGCPPCPTGNPNTTADDQWPDGSTRVVGEYPNQRVEECFRCRCCGPGGWETVDGNPQITENTNGSSDMSKSASAYVGGASASIYGTVPVWAIGTVTQITGSANASWNQNWTNRWRGSGPACGQTVSMSASGVGSASVQVAADAAQGCGASANAQSGGGTNGCGNASVSYTTPSLNLTAQYEVNSQGNEGVRLNGNADVEGGAGRVTGASGGVQFEYSANNSWTVTSSAASASGGAQFWTVGDNSCTQYCNTSGYTKGSRGTVTVGGSANGNDNTWPFYNDYATCSASASVNFGI